MTTAQPGGHAALVRTLHERGLLDDTWRRVWDAVPREPFIPARAWRQDPDGCTPLASPADRLALIHADEPVVIQLDDGAGDGPGVATSSNSQPSMVARSLGLLQVEADARVLEIGTASGHVAALLSERLGSEKVFSVELDPALAGHAAAALHAAGYRPNLRCGDGEAGWSDGAPFDAILATCALRRIPAAYVDQVRPGGVIVAPLAREFWSGALVRLTVRGDGTATGTFHGGASYMPMRSHRAGEGAPVDSGTARCRQTRLGAAAVLHLGFALWGGTRLPGVRLWHSQGPAGIQVWAQHRDGSAATAVAGDVWEYGPCDLWSEIEAAHRDYVDLGSPPAERFGLTVRPEGEYLWLHSPGNVLAPVLESEWRPAVAPSVDRLTG
ncbi:methyltransferase domain-containing protein [Streptomyces sp. NPDC127084]|uniref:methyltransferase domain-containing protein n=1 Tax=Streptomyces sp. NPDC127084 TaxID=3347133 RepID=UPI003653614F